MCNVDYCFALIPTLRFSFAFEGVGNFGKVVVLVQGSSITVINAGTNPSAIVVCDVVFHHSQPRDERSFVTCQWNR